MKMLKLVPKTAVLFCSSLLTLGSVAHAQTLLDVKIGTTANDTSADGAYQESGAAVLGSANSWWNEYGYVSSTPNGVSVVDSFDNAMSGVTLTVANSSGVGHQQNSTGTNPGFLFGDMPYQNPGASDFFTISLAGLAANTEYEFIGYAAKPSLSAGASWAVTIGTLNSGTTLNDGSSADITTGVGKSYSDFFATTDGSGNLTVVDSGNPGTAVPLLAGFQLQVAAVPEPGTWALMLAGCAIVFASRRVKFGRAS